MSDDEQGDECIGPRRTTHLVRSDPDPSFFFGLSASLLAFRFNPCLLLPNACFLPLLGMPSMVIHHVQRRMYPSAQSVTFLLVDCTAIILVVPMIFSAADSTLQMPTRFSRSVPTELHGAPSAPRREAPQQNKRTHCCSSAAFVVLARPQVVEMALSATPLAAESPGGRTSSTVDATSARNSRARRTNSQMLGPPSVLIVTCWHSKPSVHVARDGCNNNHANTTISRNQQWSRQTACVFLIRSSLCGLTSCLVLLPLTFSPAEETSRDHSCTVNNHRSCTGSWVSHPVRACVSSRAKSWLRSTACAHLRPRPSMVGHLARRVTRLLHTP